MWCSVSASTSRPLPLSSSTRHSGPPSRSNASSCSTLSRYAEWQRGRLEGEELGRQLGYWRERLAGAPEMLELPLDRPRPVRRSHRGGRLRLELGGELARGLEEVGGRRGATVFMTLLAGWAGLLGGYSGQGEVMVGTPVANRGRAEVEGMVGFLVNTLVLRVDVSGDPSFEELLGRVREEALGAYGHQELPFERLVEELRPRRDVSRSPLFQVMCGYQQGEGEVELGGVRLRELEVEVGRARFELSLALRERGGVIEGRLTYSEDLFEEGSMGRLAILSLGASPFEAALLQTVQFAPFLVLGVLVGGLVERLPLRRVIAATHLGRTVALGSIALAAAARVLTLPELYVVAAAYGVLLVAFWVAYKSYLPELVGGERLVEANAKLQVSASGAAIVGPAVAGFLIALLGVARAIIADALCFLLAALTILRVRGPEAARRPARGRGRFLEDVWQGVRLVAGHPVLWRTIPQNAMVTFGAYMNYSILLIFAYRELHLSVGVVGLIYGLGSSGWLLGALIVPRLTRALGVGRVLALSSTLIGLGILSFPLARYGPPVLVMTAAQLMVTVFCRPTWSARPAFGRPSPRPGCEGGRTPPYARWSTAASPWRPWPGARWPPRWAW
jgi:MFS family permease